MLINNTKVAEYANNNPNAMINTVPKVLVGSVFAVAAFMALATMYMIIVNI